VTPVGGSAADRARDVAAPRAEFAEQGADALDALRNSRSPTSIGSIESCRPRGSDPHASPRLPRLDHRSGVAWRCVRRLALAGIARQVVAAANSERVRRSCAEALCDGRKSWSSTRRAAASSSSS